MYIIGVKYNKKLPKINNVYYLGFLDKNNSSDLKYYLNILKKMHFNVLFSQAEAYGLVNVEASALGLYSITNDVGGISGAIKNNINGFRFNKNEKPTVIANYIIKLFNNKKRYYSKSISSRKLYEKIYNWDVISEVLKRSIK